VTWHRSIHLPTQPQDCVSRRGERGVSLIEIMVALIILGIAITMAMRTLPESNTVTTRARNVTKATNLVQQKLEQLRSLPYQDPLLSNGAHTDPGNPIDSHFTRTWTVQDDYPYTGMKRVNVTVTFPTASADSSVTISSIMSGRL
jgi:prepilin-type N-terminal cleavage/methylation domain-containing protein